MKHLIYTLLALLAALQAHAQEWQPVGQGINGSLHALEVFQGKLYIAGDFIEVEGYGPARSIVTWDGQTWDTLPFKSGIAWPTYFDLMARDSLLYVGGAPFSPSYDFSGLDTWDGQQWSAEITAMSMPGKVNSIAFYHDTLHVAGEFSHIEGQPMNLIGRKFGNQWDNLQGGLTGEFYEARPMAVFNDELYVGGTFNTAGSIPAWHIARWNGTQWDSVAGGTWGSPVAMLVDSTNNLLYVGGNFDYVDWQYMPWVAAWDGTHWHPLPGSERFQGVWALKKYRGQIFASGIGYDHVTDSVVARWDGYQWHPVRGPNYSVQEMEVYQGRLYMAGSFDTINNMAANHIASYYLPPGCGYYPTAVMRPDTGQLHAGTPHSFTHACIVTPGDSITQYHWDFGDGQTATGPTVQHTYANHGTYTVTLTITNAGGCTFYTTQQLAVAYPVTTARLPHALDVRVYPNPGKGRITLSGQLPKPATLRIYHTSGKLVARTRVPQLPHTLELALPPGSYLYQLGPPRAPWHSGTLLLH